MRATTVAVLSLEIALLGPSIAFADQRVPFSRTTATAIIRENQRVVTPNGISQLLPLEINGSKQWLSIRGSDRSNPVLLFLHGGLGSPTMPVAWTFQKPWEDYFTVVQWDQRGAGKSYASNNPKAAALSMTLPHLLFEGRHDYVVSSDVAAKWFARIHAPVKRFVWFENSAHLAYEEEPDRFLMHLINDARPLAGRGA